MAASQPGPRYSGWWRDPVNNRLSFYYNGTRVGSISAALLAVVGALTATTTLTGGTGLTVTAGNEVVTAGDHRVTAGNARLGAVSAFSVTEPTSALVMKEGTNPVGAITTSSAIFCTTGGATLSKIIAASTVSQIEA